MRKTTIATEPNVQTIFLDVPIETLHERSADRNANLPPGAFHISVQELNEWAALFEPPTPDGTTEH